MYVGAVRANKVGEGTEHAERADCDENFHFVLRSLLERSETVPCEKDAMR